MKYVKTILAILHCFFSFFSLTAQTDSCRWRYLEAYDEISNMLDEKVEKSIKRAVFLAEWAFLDGQIDYEKDFCQPLAQGAEYLRRMIDANHWEKYKTSKQIALCNFFFSPCSGNGQNPFEYDFSNEFPDDDWHYQLVSRTLKTHRGQCHSLPWAFKLYAEELDAQVYLARAPRHSFIMYRDDDDLFPENWVNVELTSHQYVPTWGIKEHYAISDSAILRGTYLAPISDEQTVACQLADLALGYYNKYKIYDEFTLKCVNKSLLHYDSNPNALIIKGKSLEAILQNHLLQNGGFCDAVTDAIDILLYECKKQLDSTQWTQETEELKKKWKMTKEEMEEARKNVIIVN